MLCSHTHKFIYLKTIKTAGTSVEGFFEKFCCSAEDYEESHSRDEYVSDNGIIGYRGADTSGKHFYNHMSAEEVRLKLGNDIFESYFKFCVIRNPYDKVVSHFWFLLNPEERERFTTVPFDLVKEHFLEFVTDKKRLPIDRHVFMIGDRFVPNFCVRYEHLNTDLRGVAQYLRVNYSSRYLPKYKMNLRTREEHFSDYYTEEASLIVEENFSYEIEKIGYQLCDPWLRPISGRTFGYSLTAQQDCSPAPGSQSQIDPGSLNDRDSRPSIWQAAKKNFNTATAMLRHILKPSKIPRTVQKRISTPANAAEFKARDKRQRARRLLREFPERG